MIILAIPDSPAWPDIRDTKIQCHQGDSGWGRWIDKLTSAINGTGAMIHVLRTIEAQQRKGLFDLERSKSVKQGKEMSRR